MVAIIHSATGIRPALNYNENKINSGVATCLAAGNYPLEAEDLTYQQKLGLLEKLAALNGRAKQKALHISLNFAPSEKLSPEQLTGIATEYLERIGFGNQPYLIYQHHDAGHPHLHLVTTPIRTDGSRIKTHRIGQLKSEPARKAIEEKYGLIRAEDHRRSLMQVKPVNAGKIHYGTSDTRRAIYNVLAGVLKTYKYTSLPELNALLRRYNVEADRGGEQSRTYKNRGLYYRVLDKDGIPVGVPIKASLLPGRPTLSFLEQRFKVGDALRQPHKLRLQLAIDLALHHPKASIKSLTRELDKKGIETIIRRTDTGTIYGLTYVDHYTKCVWNGSDLGKAYSAKGVLERCVDTELLRINSSEAAGQSKAQTGPVPPARSATPAGTPPDAAEARLLEQLLQTEQGADYLPPHLRKKKRKKKSQSRKL